MCVVGVIVQNKIKVNAMNRDSFAAQQKNTKVNEDDEN